jgi:hypothetical protein
MIQIEFCNPGLFGASLYLSKYEWALISSTLDNYPTFRRVYEVPILKSRSPDASAKEIEIGEARMSQV